MMLKTCRPWLARLSCGLTLAFALTVWGQAPAADPTAPVVLDLPLSLHTAQDLQPSVRAARASLASAQTQARTLEGMGVVAWLKNHDLPVRKKQACLGVTAATGNLSAVEAETNYAVTRTYLSVQYARAQRQVAGDVSKELEFYQKQVKQAVEGKEEKDKDKDKDKVKPAPREWTTSTVDKLTIYRRLAENKLTEAERGVEQATAGLREAIGLDPCTPVTVMDSPLSEPQKVELCREEIVSLALDRRGEVVQASALAEIACLEIDAQGKECLPGVVRTFAAAADIHAKVLPATVANGEYRPGALAPEMPVYLVGSKSDRQQRARELAQRNQAVADKTRNLVALDATNAYLKYQEALKKVEQSRDAKIAGERLAKNTRADFRADQKVRIDDVLTNEILAAQGQSAYNEAVLLLNIALADLERATAGGFCAGFLPPAAPEAIPAPKKN